MIHTLKAWAIWSRSDQENFVQHSLEFVKPVNTSQAQLCPEISHGKKS